MRAGTYAVVGGHVYHASYAVNGQPVGLIVHGDHAPDGFVRDERVQGWYRRVQRSDCSRLFYVATAAYWREFLPVTVEAVNEHLGGAVVRFYPGSHVPAPPPAFDEDELLNSGFRIDHGAGYLGDVWLSDLTQVREQEHELPLVVQSRGWRYPDPPMLTKPHNGPPYTEEELHPGGQPKDRSHKRGRPRRLGH